MYVGKLDFYGFVFFWSKIVTPCYSYACVYCPSITSTEVLQKSRSIETPLTECRKERKITAAHYLTWFLFQASCTKEGCPATTRLLECLSRTVFAINQQTTCDREEGKKLGDKIKYMHRCKCPITFFFRTCN